MGLKYYNEFRGLDNVLNRIEIHDKSSVTTREVTTGASPFVIEYSEVKKLEAIQVSGARLNLISKTNLEFLDLHTDNMQKYLVRFYRGGSLFWLGWLDSELYSESFTDVPPYNVEFSASDFNILERLKFLDSFGNKYMDIQPLSVQLKRCFDLLELPFEKMYIGCSTVAEGVPISGSESVLHTMYIQSRNFYDEEGEPMSCRDVVSSILEPFGLVLVQRDASIYIFDYNTIKGAGVFKAYNYSDMQYIGDEAVISSIGDINNIGIAEQESSLEFEEMVNNVKITCSLYADPSLDVHEVTEDNVYNLLYKEESYSQKNAFYKNASGWTDDGLFAITQRSGKEIVAGLDIKSEETIKTHTIALYGGYVLGGDQHSITIDAKIRIIDEDRREGDVERKEKAAVVFRLPVKLYIINDSLTPIKYAAVEASGRPAYNTIVWKDIPTDGNIPDIFFYFLKSEVESEQIIVNGWADLMNYTYVGEPPEGSPKYIEGNRRIGKGLDISISGIQGVVMLEIRNEYKVYNPMNKSPQQTNPFDPIPPIPSYYDTKEAEYVLINNIELSLRDRWGDVIKPPDVVFDSYINKAVKSDLTEKNLYVVSANEDSFSLGYGLLLGKSEGTYFSQTSFTRSGQTDILERLLMCTIHSNFAPKNMKLSVIIKMGENPAMRTATASPLLPGEFLITGCSLDFAQANTNITGVHYSEDTAKLSNIPYV